MARSFKQGKYSPRHPEKYVGDLNDITFRSAWEESVMKFLDNNPNILKWSSEPIGIWYVKPTDGKKHRYIPDFYIMYKDVAGKVHQELLEIKPSSQAMPSKSRSQKRRIEENIVFAVNAAKWAAAQVWCKHHGMSFRVLTESEIFH